MKLKDGWVLTKVGDDYAAVPTNESAEDFRGIISLNESGKDIWQGLVDGLDEERIADRLMDMYEIDSRDTAVRAVEKVINILKEEGILKDE